MSPMQHSVVILGLFHCALGTVDVVKQGVNPAPGKCGTYTFHVGESSCKEGSIADDVGLLKSQVTSLKEEKASFQKQISLLVDKEIDLQKRLSTLEKRSYLLGNSNHGAVYIRWGRSQCASDATLLYEGYMAGTHFTNRGGTSDRLCLPQDPQWQNSGFQPSWDFYESPIYGTEYEIKSTGNPFGIPNIKDQNVPCAFCTTPGRFSMVTLPAKTSCPKGWFKEYSGFMMSSYGGKGRPNTMAVCVDARPEFVAGGRQSENQARLYIMVTKCGSLHCPPYKERELACAVCTK